MANGEVTERQLFCPHMTFEASVDVNRLSDTDGGPINTYSADIRIQCAECGQPFSFLGLPCGSLKRGASVSVDGHEARMAITPGVGGLFAPPTEGDSHGVDFVIRKG